MSYEYGNRFAAFIDILGFKQMIAKIEDKSAGHDLLFTRLTSVLNFLNDESIESNGNHDLLVYEERDGALVERELGDPKITYVSDCAIISTEATLDGFKSLCNKLTKLSTDLACDGMFVRGAITYGPLFHDRKFVFGSAYQRAYEIESTKVNTPRIVIDDSALNFLEEKEGVFPLNSAGSRVDTDGLRYLHCFPWQYFPLYAGDWLNFLLRVKGHIIYSLNYHDSRCAGFPDRLKALDRFYCWKEIHGWQIDFSGSSAKVLEKYIWLKDEFNRTLDQCHKFLSTGTGTPRVAKIVDLGSHWGPEVILGRLR